jgi:WD40 repeat protein
MTGNSPEVDQWNSRGISQKTVLVSSRTSRLSSMSVSPNGQQLVTAENDGVIRIWNLAGQLLAKSDKVQGEISRIVFWDNQRIVTAGADGMVRIWRLSGQELVLSDSWQAHEGVITGLSLNPEKSLLVTCGDGVVAKIWNLLDWENPITFPVVSDAIVSVSFIPKSDRIATAEPNGTIRFWDFSGQPVGKLDLFYLDQLRHINFSPDGQRIVTIATNGIVRLWDWRGRQLAQFENDKDSVADSSFKPQETNQLLLVSQHGNLRLEQIQNLDQLLVRNCKFLKNYLADYPEGSKICLAR